MLDLVPVWTVILGARRLHVRAARRLRSRRRHPVPVCAATTTATLMMNSVAPIWDGNETWLVLGGLGLLAAFPLAFAIIIPALYFPLLLDAARPDLSRRRVRVPAQGDEPPPLWDRAFFWGSLDRDVLPGRRARHVRPRLRGDGRVFAGTSFDWVLPFPLLDRRRPAVRLRAARRDLARHEDRGRAAGVGARVARRSRCTACSRSSRW